MARLDAIAPAALLGISLLGSPRLFGAECANCVPHVEGAKLCAPHAEQETKALADLEKRLRGSKDAKARIAILEEIAALTASHANAPSKRVVEAIAVAFRDDSGDVRRAAARLARVGQHAETARALLIEAMRTAAKEVDKHQKRLDRFYENIKKAEGKKEREKAGGTGQGDLPGGWIEIGAVLKETESLEKAIAREGDLIAASSLVLVDMVDPKAQSAVRAALKPLAASQPGDVSGVSKEILAAGQYEDVKAVVEVVIYFDALAKRAEEQTVVVHTPGGGSTIIFQSTMLHAPEVYEQLRKLGEARKLPTLAEFDKVTYAATLAKWFKEAFPRS